MNTYLVKRRLLHDGVFYGPNEDVNTTIDLPPKEAGQLLLLKNSPIVKIVSGFTANTGVAIKAISLNEAISIIAEEMPRDEDKFAGDKPKASAVSDLTGNKVNGLERDKAWAGYLEKKAELSK